jgi:hypothetical protein
MNEGQRNQSKGEQDRPAAAFAPSAMAAINGNNGKSRSWSKLPANTILAGQPNSASSARQAAKSARPKMSVRADIGEQHQQTIQRHHLIGLDLAEPGARIADEALRVFIRCEAY